jgi:hypothetical protein
MPCSEVIEQAGLKYTACTACEDREIPNDSCGPKGLCDEHWAQTQGPMGYLRFRRALAAFNKFYNANTILLMFRSLTQTWQAQAAATASAPAPAAEAASL